MSLRGAIAFWGSAAVAGAIGAVAIANIGGRRAAQTKADLSRSVLEPAQVTYAEPLRLPTSTTTSDLYVWTLSVDGQRFVVVANHNGVAMHALAPAAPSSAPPLTNPVWREAPP